MTPEAKVEWERKTLLELRALSAEPCYCDCPNVCHVECDACSALAERVRRGDWYRRPAQS